MAKVLQCAKIGLLHVALLSVAIEGHILKPLNERTIPTTMRTTGAGTCTKSRGASDHAVFLMGSMFITRHRGISSAGVEGSIDAFNSTALLKTARERTREDGAKKADLAEREGLNKQEDIGLESWLTAVRAVALVACVLVPAIIFEWAVRRLGVDGAHFSKAEDMPHLTGLRGLASLTVMVCHSRANFPNPLNTLGGQPVYLFFLLSGFLMGRLYFNKPFTLVSVSKYVAARVGRIFPLYYFVLIPTCMMMSYLKQPVSTLEALKCGATFSWAPMQMWSVPVEVQFYGIFIPLWWAHSQFGILPVIVFTALILILYCVPLPGGVHFSLVECSCGSTWCTLQYLPLFAIGTMLGARWDDVARWIKDGWVLSTAAPLCGIAFFAHHYITEPWWREQVLAPAGLKQPLMTATHLPLDPFAYLFAVGLLIGAAHSTPTLNILSSSVLRFYGRISFACYLIHLQMYKVAYLKFDPSNWFRALEEALIPLLTFVLATASLHLLEGPARQVIARHGEMVLSAAKG